PHHVIIEITAEGASVCQLSGRLPVRLDGAPLDGVVNVRSRSTLEIGHSILSMSPGELTGPGQNGANVSATARGQVLVRGPRAAPELDLRPLQPLADHRVGNDSSGGLLPALLALGGSGLLAILVHQPMFLLFGAIGAVAALGTWGGQRIGTLRRRRSEARARAEDAARFEREVACQRQQFLDHHRAHASTPASARQALEGPTAQLWARRGSHADAFAVSLGLGTIAWTPQVAERRGGDADQLTATSLLPDLPIVADLGSGCRLAVRGERERTEAIVRSLLVQLAANCGPADVRFVVVTRYRERWAWLEPLPHATTAATSLTAIDDAELPEAIAELDAASGMHIVVVTDAPEVLATRTSPLRRAMSGDRSMAVIVLVPATDGVPHMCTSLVDVGGPMLARWHADAALASLPEQVRWAGISECSAAALAHRVAGLVDPEDVLTATRAVPRDVGLLSLLPRADVLGIVDAWAAGGLDPAPRTPIGIATDGVVDIDLVRDGPHALLAGTTGAGKSELLRSLVAGLAVACSPDHVNFVLIDYKGGATFDACAELPHVVGVVTDLDDHLADRALRSLQAELRRREQLLRDGSAADLSAYRRAPTAHPLPRLVVVVDEFASLVAEQPEFLHALVGIAQRGRSLGVHLILATQRPNGVISDDIRANTNLRLALRLHDAGDALDVVGDRSPATISRSMPGRAVVRLGPEEVLTFQTARCTAGEADGTTALEQRVSAVRSAFTSIGGHPPRPPWLAPLPTEIPVDDDALARGAVGLVDDPDRQQIVPLHWRTGQGHLLLVGSAGSGTTSALVLLGCAAIAAGSGCHVWAIDGRGDPTLDGLLRSPWCGGVVRLHERDRLVRLLNRLGRELTTRVADPGAPRQPIVVLVDGFELVRTSLDELETSPEFEVLDTIAAVGAAHDITLVAAFDRAAAVPSVMLARCSERWLFHVGDPLDAAALG
ncbi:MAG TPA: FtsK/SpoIIIE domain-containing protein, partial [Ilumatobacteraceae bacterium]|nr:FtsK/SpoIIIE domain-containing protein [Ilumatobacteraceae bacterium]